MIVLESYNNNDLVWHTRADNEAFLSTRIVTHEQVNGDVSGESNEVSFSLRERTKEMKIKQAVPRYTLHTFSFLSRGMSIGPLVSALHGNATIARKTHNVNSNTPIL